MGKGSKGGKRREAAPLRKRRGTMPFALHSIRLGGGGLSERWGANFSYHLLYHVEKKEKGRGNPGTPLVKDQVELRGGRESVLGSSAGRKGVKNTPVGVTF